jgi:hypothetical protein
MLDSPCKRPHNTNGSVHGRHIRQTNLPTGWQIPLYPCFTSSLLNSWCNHHVTGGELFFNVFTLFIFMFTRLLLTDFRPNALRNNRFHNHPICFAFPYEL